MKKILGIIIVVTLSFFGVHSASALTIGLTPATDTGVLNNDLITNLRTPVFAGTASAGTSITVKPQSGVAYCSATVGVGGDWQCTPNRQLPLWTQIISATHTVSGEAVSISASFVVDTENITSVYWWTVTAVDDTGLNNFDKTTAHTQPLIVGGAEPYSRVSVRFDNVTACTATTSSNGRFECRKATPINVSNRRTVTVSFVEIDQAGNSAGPTVSSPIIIDVSNSIPAGIPDLQSANDTGTSSSDNYTTTTTLRFKGASERGGQLNLYRNGTLVCNTIVPTNEKYDCTDTVPHVGVYDYVATELDKAGNLSPTTAVATVIVYEVVTVPQLHASSDTGSQTTDNITLDNTPRIVGQNAPANSVVELWLQNGSNTSTHLTSATSSGSWSVQIDVPLVDGEYTLTAKQKPVGRSFFSVPSNAITVTIDTQLLESATPDLDTVSDTGLLDTDNYTKSTELIIVGVAPETYVQVDISETPTGITLCSDNTESGFNWGCAIAFVEDGTHTYYAKYTDRAGNQAVSVMPLVVTVATLPPNTPTSFEYSNSASSSGGITTEGEPYDFSSAQEDLTFEGIAPPGTLVKIYADDGHLACQLDEFLVNGGPWSCEVINLDPGLWYFALMAEDLAGNESPLSSPITILVTEEV